MDAYYANQVNAPYFRGSARQRGRGFGSVALTVGRAAIPLIRKFVLPAAKRMGKTALELAVPELMEIATGKTKPKAAAKRIAKATLKKQLGGGLGGSSSLNIPISVKSRRRPRRAIHSMGSKPKVKRRAIKKRRKSVSIRRQKRRSTSRISRPRKKKTAAPRKKKKNVKLSNGKYDLFRNLK